MAKLETMTVDEVMTFFGVCKSTVYKLVGAGYLPRPIKLGRKNVWLKSSIEKAVQGITKKSEANLRYHKGVI